MEYILKLLQCSQQHSRLRSTQRSSEKYRSPGELCTRVGLPRNCICRKQRFMQINIALRFCTRRSAYFPDAIACRATTIAAGIAGPCTASRAHTSSTRHHAIKGAREVKKKEREKEGEREREEYKVDRVPGSFFFLSFFSNLAPAIGHSSSPRTHESPPYGESLFRIM